MRILDRYLLRQYVQTFLVCYLSLTGMYIVFDAFTNLDGFLRCAEKTGGLLPLMASFYSYQSIMLFDRTAGLLSLVAAMFTVVWIRRHNEMTALEAAGVSRLRVIRPVIIAGIALAALATVNRELVMPRFREQLNRRSQDLIGDIGQLMDPCYDNTTGVLIRGKVTFGDQQRIADASFVMPPALQHYGKQFAAAEAFYRPAEGNHPSGYLLVGVHEPKSIDSRASLTLRGQPVVITRHDAPDWLAAGECFVASDVTFDQVTGGRGFRQFASTAELITGLRNPSRDFGADVRVAIHTRIVQPLLDVTLLFLGLPLVVTRYNRNVFIVIGLGLGLVTVFLLTAIGLQYLGDVCLVDPALAAWGPLLIFIPAAVALGEGMRE